MSVYLSGRYLFMAQHALDCPEVGASFKQMGGKRVAESVWTDSLVYPRFGRQVLYYVKHHYPGYGAASPYAQEQETLRARLYVNMATVSHIEFYLMYGPARYGNQPLLAALARNLYETLLKKEVLHLE